MSPAPNQPNLPNQANLEPEEVVRKAGDLSAAASPQRARPRSNPRTAQTHDLGREAGRSNTVVTGRDGEVLSRKRTQVGDVFDLPEELKEPGWTYQWVAVSVAGDTQVTLDQVLMMKENGWREVQASRFPGRFMPEGHTGGIVRGGQMLMERPESLTKEAQDEDYRKAYQQMRDRDESLMGRKANVKGAMGEGLVLQPRTAYKGRRTQMGIDEAYDIPAPNYSPADDTVA